MKKIIFTIIFVAIMGLIWFDIFCNSIQIVAKQMPEVGADPQKAVIIAVIAGVTGIVIFLWRRIGDIRK